MFGISSGELFFIAIIALIVLGPERLPKATRLAGMWVRRARTQWNTVKDELERELAAEELKRSLQDAQSALRDTEQRIRDSGDEARKEFEQMRASVYMPPDQADADPGQADLEQADLEQADLERADLERADLEQTDQVQADPARTNPETETRVSETPDDSVQSTRGEGDEPRNA